MYPVVGVYVNDPSLANVTVPWDGSVTETIVSESPSWSVSLDRTPGDETVNPGSPEAVRIVMLYESFTALGAWLVPVIVIAPSPESVPFWGGGSSAYLSTITVSVMFVSEREPEVAARSIGFTAPNGAVFLMWKSTFTRLPPAVPLMGCATSGCRLIPRTPAVVVYPITFHPVEAAGMETSFTSEVETLNTFESKTRMKSPEPRPDWPAEASES